MNDGPALVCSLIALGAGTLLTRSVLGDSPRWRVPTIIALVLITIACLGGVVVNRPMGPALVTLVTSLVLWFIHFKYDEKTDPEHPGDGFLPAAITSGIACGTLLIPLMAPVPRPVPSEPILVLDQVTERTELLADINLAILEVDLALERDLPARERAARDAESWSRLESLTRIRTRVQNERQRLALMAESLQDPSAPLPDPEELLTVLASIDRLLGAVKIDR